MDSGAHFHRCDLQVHSPRDRQWDGPRPTTEDERKQYAARFVQACRDKSLHAVAITDHHDLVFFPYIKEAAEGNPVVFPGMELTLAVPCQALLILDADFPVSLLSQVPTALGLPFPNVQAEQHGQPQAIPDSTSIKQVIALLDRHDFLRGRYILIPNVTENGHKTLIRAGFSEQYRTAPCVAGYLDGPTPTEDRARGWRAIVEGRDVNYGNRRIGLFQTSDSRRNDFSTLGLHSTWIKWAEPTAEALRQACLASDTRISQTSPELPSVVIRRLAVSNCKFLGPFDVVFNSQYNALIGGRGTGKSTVLEYLRWGLCDQPPEVDDEGDLPNFQSRRDQLIKNTLAPHQGVVTVEFELNGVPHAVRRKSEPHELKLKIGEGEYASCSERDVRELLPVQAYSQKQLSVVGVHTDELLRLIRSPIESALLDLDRESGELQKDLRAIAERRYTFGQTQRDLHRLDTELSSSRAQLQRLRDGLKGVSTEDQEVLDANAEFEAESLRISSVERQLRVMREAADRFTQDLSKGARGDTGQRSSATAPTPSAVANIEDQLDAMRAQAIRQASDIAASLTGGQAATALAESVAVWKSRYEAHKNAYGQAKERASSQSVTLKAINELEDRTRQLTERQSESRLSAQQLGDPQVQFEETVQRWIEMTARRADLLDRECHGLTELSEGRIRASIQRGANTEALVERLASLCSGSRIRREKLEAIGAHVAASETPAREWCALADEFYLLIPPAGQQFGEAELPPTPKLSAIGFTPQELGKISTKLSLTEWLALLLTGVDDVPTFEYRQSEGDFIDFANASAGQQATALLKVLLNQNGPPLVIDQPEDDLDNEVVLEIVGAIWKAKSKRQVIVSSHNANVVVNGDADLVVVFGYRQAADHSLGRIAESGAIDVQRIRNAITSIMEGGERAFRLRQEKYGF